MQPMCHVSVQVGLTEEGSVSCCSGPQFCALTYCEAQDPRGGLGRDTLAPFVEVPRRVGSEAESRSQHLTAACPNLRLCEL